MKFIKSFAVTTTLFMLFTATAQAQTKGSTCYGGTLNNSSVKNVTEVFIKLGDGQQRESSVIFYKGKSKYFTDLFCPKNFIGRCSILDDGGSIEIKSMTSKEMVIQFNGKPQLAEKDGGDVVPDVDSNAMPTPPITMHLTVKPETDC